MALAIGSSHLIKKLINMKQYPSIQRLLIDNIPNINFYLFSKIDGSNIRAEWNNKRGFYKFGTRHQLIDNNSKPFGASIELIKTKYEKDISDICKANKIENIVCFFEYYGPSSFAGNHNFDEQLDVILFDANPYKRGILPPSDFITLFGDLDIPTVVHQGKITPNVYSSIRESTLPGVTFEGVVGKGMDGKQLAMYKIKSQAWLDKLKIFCKDDESLFNKLV
jgi:hypothetical protein